MGRDDGSIIISGNFEYDDLLSMISSFGISPFVDRGGEFRSILKDLVT